MILALPACFALRQEGADLAVIAAVRRGFRAAVDRGLEPPSHAAIVCGHVREPDPEALPRAEDDVGGLGLETLHAPERLTVEAELEPVLGLRAPGQLRVEHDVAPGTERRGRVHTLEKIRDSAPRAVQENGLVDVLRAAPHRIFGCPRRGLPVARLAQSHLDHRVTALAQRLKIRELVRLAFTLEQFREGVLAGRTRASTHRHGQFELGQVLARDEVAEVGR